MPEGRTTACEHDVSDDCPHGLPTRGACFECMLDGPIPKPPQPAVEIKWTTTARFQGRCRECQQTIYIGEVIVSTLDNVILHEVCYLEMD